VDEQMDDEKALNEIRWLATHNSSHGLADPVRFFMINLFNRREAAALKYNHQSLTSQLSLGIRSFEMDLRIKKGRFVNCHVPLVDNRSPFPDLEFALKELLDWSEKHPKHCPIVILVELKDDWDFLDPTLAKWSASKLIELDQLFFQVLGSRQITPSQVCYGGMSLRDSVIGNGWPKLKESRGTFLTALMVNENHYALNGDEYLIHPFRKSFIMPDSNSDEAGFLIFDDPYNIVIPELKANGFIIRTRADADLIPDINRKCKALSSGAQIVSTDFPEGYLNNPNGYSVSWNELLKDVQKTD
jgi:hypothetical protein